MVISKIYPEPNGENYILHKEVANLNADVLILVPDEQTLHEVKGLALLLNKETIVEVLEPGKELPWSSYMYSPWHVNTDKYTLTFGITNELQTPHLVYAPSYLTTYKD